MTRTEGLVNVPAAMPGFARHGRSGPYGGYGVTVS
ncbi:hypothetical protein FRAHR75_1580009 [Frankia sp. Hr75.2]|nr:hypothetical protein FRAHR75_1580009 [Frankia sp. Hr75.2]